MKSTPKVWHLLEAFALCGIVVAALAVTFAQTPINTYVNAAGNTVREYAPSPEPPPLDAEFGTVTVETLVVTSGNSVYKRAFDDETVWMHERVMKAGGPAVYVPLTPAQAQAKGLPR